MSVKVMSAPLISSHLSFDSDETVVEEASIAFMPIERQKHACPWCHGMTFDDDRGNCCACGGRRDQ